MTGDSPRSRALRAGASILALVVCAWFVIGIRQSHEIAVASAIVAAAGQPTPRALSSAAGELRGADFLNPDQEVNILRGRLAIKQGQVPRARRLLAAVTRTEPRNLEAWIWFTGASLGDRPAARFGTAKIAELDPLDAKIFAR